MYVYMPTPRISRTHTRIFTPTYPHTHTSYTFQHSLADGVATALARGLLTALVGALVLCLHYAGRGGEGAGRVGTDWAVGCVWFCG